MAGSKKASKELKLEEKLKRALVPAEEQPYEVPGNWRWIYLLDSFENQTDSRKKVLRKTYLKKGKLAVVDQGKELVSGYTDDENMAFLGRLPVVIFGDHTRCIKYIDFPFAQGADGIKVLLPNSFYLPKAFYYALQSIEIPDLGYRRHYPLFSQFKIPLPPFAEQQRIVGCIENLFAKLDEAKEKIQTAVEGFDLRKSAILSKAFTGGLTQRFRNQHGIGTDSWEDVVLSDVCEINPHKINTKNLPDDLEVSFYPMSALSEVNGEIVKPKIRLLKEVRSGFMNFSKGDVVFAKITPCMENGKSAVIGDLVNQIGYGSTEFYVLRCGERLYNRYLYHLVRARCFRYEAKAAMNGSAGQQRVPKRFLETYPLRLPSISEQKAISKILDEIFAKEIKIKDISNHLLSQIGVIKKSILIYAFKGKLGTNRKNEENALEM